MSQRALDSDIQSSYPTKRRRAPASDEAHASPSVSPPSIDHSMMPHIFDAILADVPPDAFPTLRGVSRELRDWADERMAKHIVLCCDDSTLPRPASRPTDDGFRSLPTIALPTTCDTATNDGDPLPTIMTAIVRPLGSRAGQFPAFHGWNATRHEGDAKFDDTQDALLKKTAAVDFIGTLSRLQTITAMLNVPVPVVRFISDDWPNALAEEALQADTVVVFTRPMTRRFGNVHPETSVRRLVIHIGVPRVGLLPRVGDTQDGDEGSEDFYEGPWICAPNGPLSATEIVYIFDPAWADVEVHLRSCSMLDPILSHVSGVLTSTNVKLVGLEAFPITAFPVAHRCLRPPYLTLEKLHSRLDSLDDILLPDPALASSWDILDKDTYSLLRLDKLLPPDGEDLSIREIRDRAAEKMRRVRYGTMRVAVEDEVKWEITRSVRAMGARSHEFPYHPRSRWPLRQVEKLIDKNLGFCTWDEYRALVDQDEWLLHTVGYNSS